MKITSVNNDLVKETAKLLRGKYRDETGLFLIEGEKGVKEAIEAGVNIKYIFALERFKDYPEEITIETTEAVLSKISDTKTAPKAIAVAHQPKQDFDLLKKVNKVVLLEGIRLDEVNEGMYFLSAAPLNIGKAEGAPCRAILIECN